MSLGGVKNNQATSFKRYDVAKKVKLCVSNMLAFPSHC